MAHYIPIDEQKYADAALNLLSSSSVGTFVRIADSLPATHALRELLHLNIVNADVLCDYAETLWESLVEKSQRDIEETELAIILPVISRTAHPKSEELLTRFSLSINPSATWISELARQLLNEYSSNQDISSKSLIDAVSDISYPRSAAENSFFTEDSPVLWSIEEPDPPSQLERVINPQWEPINA